MPMRNPLLFIPMVLLPLSSFSCAVQVKDAQFCSPLPEGLGAVCDNYLTADQLILDGQGWIDLQAQWASDGQATECTNSGTFGDIKTEIEELCSVAPCHYKTKKMLLKGLVKIRNLGKEQLRTAH